MSCNFIYDNKMIGYSSITANNIDSDYDIENILNGEPSMSALTTANNTYIKIDLGSAKTVQAISLHNHTIDRSATVLCVFSTDNFSTVTNVDVSDMINDSYSNAYYFFQASYSYRYIGLNISGASGAFQIGEFFAGLALDPTINYNWGYSKYYYTDAKIKSHGQHYKSKTFNYRGYRIYFENYPSGTSYENAINQIVDESAIVFVPDTSIDDCMHGIIAETEIERVENAGSSSNLHSFQLTFLENAVVSS